MKPKARCPNISVPRTLAPPALSRQAGDLSCGLLGVRFQYGGLGFRGLGFRGLGFRVCSEFGFNIGA